VNWGPVDVFIGATATMLLVITILNLGGAIGTNVGFKTSIPSPEGYYIGSLSSALMLILIIRTQSPMRPILLATLMGVAVVGLSYTLASKSETGAAIFMGLQVSNITATTISAALVVTGITYSLIKYQQPISALGFVKTAGFQPYIYAVSTWLTALIVLMIWSQVLIWVEADWLAPPNTAMQALDETGGRIFITMFLVSVAGPIAEEIFFRGFMISGLIRRFGIRHSLFISSFFFGLFHIDPGAIVPAFVLGLALGWVYLKARSIWPVIFAHSLHNTVAILVAKYT
jgi:membrane protease YdiL (CAAX protease family)